MNSELQTQLKEKYPLVFAKMFVMPEKGIPFHCIQAFGIECGPGWYDIIDECASKIEPLIAALPEDQRIHYAANQIKEKFGGLRFYLGAETDEMYKITSQAEDASYHVCEICGRSGKLDQAGWWVTICWRCDLRRKLKRKYSNLKYDIRSLFKKTKKAVSKVFHLFFTKY